MEYLRKAFLYFIVITILFFLIYGIYIFFQYQINWKIIIFIFGYFTSLIVGIVIFVQKRNVNAKLSWLLLICLVPIFGPIMYLMFGRRYKGRMPQTDYFKKYYFTHNKQLPSNVSSSKTFNALHSFSKRPILYGDLKIYTNVMYSFVQLFKDIKAAKKYIHLNYFIIKPSEIWDELKELLIKKAAEGVEVRFIMDDFGCWSLSRNELSCLSKKGIQIQVYNKIVFPFISYKSGIRSHRKYIVIDSNSAYIGGANISDEYVSYDVKYGIWEDVVSRVEGPIVQSFILLFINDWYLLSKKILDVDKFTKMNNNVKSKWKNELILIEDTPELNESVTESILIKLINNSKKSIKITTPYFIPTQEIISSLKIAALSGIKIRIYFPGIPDVYKNLGFDASRGYASELMNYGVEFKALNNRFLHSKIGLFDDKIAYVGTSNIDMRSLYSQLENNLYFKGNQVKNIVKIFDRYDDNSKYVNKLKLKPNTITKKLRVILLKLFAPLM